MTIRIDRELEARLRAAAAAAGQDLNTYAVSALREALDRMDTGEPLTAGEAEAVRASLQDFAAGRFRSEADVAAELRAKYNLPSHLSDSELGAS